jgi:hypothetical protein
LDNSGAVAGLVLDGTPLDISAGGFHITEYLPPNGRQRDLGPVRGTVEEASGGADLKASLSGADLRFSVRFRNVGARIEVEGEVADSSGRDRALLVSFRLPIQAAGWWWADDLDRRRRIQPGAAYAIDEGYGEHKDIPISRVAFSAISAARKPQNAGLSLAIPMHEPRVFRFFYDEHGYQVSFQLGLAPEVEKASATFRFVLYRHDPAWGLRSAAQRYYDFFPELYLKRVRDGGFGFFLNRSGILPPNIEDFAPAFAGVAGPTLTPTEAALVKKYNLITFTHREPWAWWHLVQFADNKNVRRPSRLAEPGDPQQPPLEQELAIIEKKKQEPPEILDGNGQIPGPVREVAAAAQHTFIYDENNRPRRLLWHLWSTRNGMGWHSQIPLNASPHVPSPSRSDLARKYQFPNIAAWDNPAADHVPGVSFDSTGDWTGFRYEDYRRDNFRYEKIPLTFSPRNGRVLQIAGFHSWEMIRTWSREFRAKERYLMANTKAHAYIFCEPYLDLIGIELGADAVAERDLALLRTIAYRKTVGYYRPITVKGMRKLLLYGIFPTVGLVGSPKEAEAARPLYKKYAPLIQKMAKAGWQPVTHARFRNPPAALLVERFGDAAVGVYLAARNIGPKAATAVLDADLAPMGFGDGAAVGAQELVEERPVTAKQAGGTLSLNVRLAAGETLVFGLRSESRN